MKSNGYKIITTIIAILGGIGSILFWVQHNFLVAICCLVPTIILCLIFYGIASILAHLENLDTDKISVNENKAEVIEKETNINDVWKYPELEHLENLDADRITEIETKKKDVWVCPECHTENPYSQAPECSKCHWKP